KTGQPPLYILTTLAEKIALLETLGLDRLVVIPFTPAFSQTPSDVFVRDILFRVIGMQAIVIGHDHGFGRNREGDVATLLRLGRELGFTVHELPPLQQGESVISSTQIRRALLAGEIEQANAWLADTYRLSARVIRGEGRGRTIGFPTANLEPLHPQKLIPAHGVYAVRVRLAGQEWGGMMNIGMRPTFAGSGRTLEVHLFDFTGDLYDQEVEVHFVARLRPEMKFATVAALQAQLQGDRAASLRVLNAAAAPPAGQGETG
ncbi:MAG: riboflavin biosynthesis protein RibF, partial [candidate division KSB1 bacterium]|nr:riboflavin biosynthesis protein RibF [candidate division KSB1 bacterium]